MKIGVFFGGESVEHEISIISAIQALHALDKSKYEVFPIYLSKNREWYTGEALFNIDEYKRLDDLLEKCQRIVVVGNEGKAQVERYPAKVLRQNVIVTLDLAIPIMHGTHGEDGAIQGFFEMNGIPYVGCDVISAAVGQDKVFMKQIFRGTGLPIVDFAWYYASDWLADKEACLNAIEQQLDYPLIVKPARLGSSIGISVANDRESLANAIITATTYDQKFIVETHLVDVVEVNCSVLGNSLSADASVLEEVMSQDEFLSFTDKYEGDTTGLKIDVQTNEIAMNNRLIPARLTEDGTQYVQELALRTFRVLGGFGVCRIDFLIDATDNNVYVNEINTMPGSLAFYLWEQSGVERTVLMDRLIKMALKRKTQRNKSIHSFKSNLFTLQGSGAKKAGM